MNAATVLARIASAVGIRRVRNADAARDYQNGGSVRELRGRADALMRRLEHVAEKLENTLT